MTEKRSRELGKERGTTVAESVCLEPPFDRLPAVLEKWRKQKAWEERVEKEKYVMGRFPELNWTAFRTAFITSGRKFVLDYIKELKEDGLLRGK